MIHNILIVLTILIFIFSSTVDSATCVNSKAQSAKINCLNCIKKETFGRNCYWVVDKGVCDHQYFSAGANYIIDREECVKQPGVETQSSDEIIDSKTAELVNLLAQLDMYDIIMSNKKLFRSLLKFAYNENKLPKVDVRYLLKDLYRNVCPKPVKMISLAVEISAASQISAAKDAIKDATASIVLDSCNLGASITSVVSSTAGGIVAIACSGATLAKDFKTLAGAVASKGEAEKFYSVIKQTMEVGREMNVNCKYLNTVLHPDISTQINPDNSFVLNIKPKILASATDDFNTMITDSYLAVCKKVGGTCVKNNTPPSLFMLQFIVASQKMDALGCDRTLELKSMAQSVEGQKDIQTIATSFSLVTLRTKVCIQDIAQKDVTYDKVKCDPVCKALKAFNTFQTTKLPTLKPEEQFTEFDKEWFKYLKTRVDTKDCVFDFTQCK